MADRDDSREQDESRRIIERVAREAHSGSSPAVRMVRRARDHIAATDADRDDWAEYWGTRIGRIAGLLLMVGLIAWILLFLLRGD